MNYEECNWCKKSIDYDEEYLAITVNKEKADKDGIEILDSEVILLICEKCSVKVPLNKFKAAIDNTQV